MAESPSMAVRDGTSTPLLGPAGAALVLVGEDDVEAASLGPREEYQPDRDEERGGRGLEQADRLDPAVDDRDRLREEAIPPSWASPCTSSASSLPACATISCRCSRWR